MYRTATHASALEHHLPAFWPRLVGPVVTPTATLGYREVLPTLRHDEFSQRLQAELDPEHIMALLAETLAQSLPFAGLSYHTQPAAIVCRHGHTTARHRADYRLKVHDQDLGEIRFYRDFPFSEAELMAIEDLLGLSLYPLRNALRYREALALAAHDPLTGLLNRTTLDHHANRELALTKRLGQPLALLIADLDRFKAINDTHGHLAGDRVLRVVAECLQQEVRESDLLFRYGGEEFLVLLPNTDRIGARQLADRLREAVLQLGPCGIAADLTVSVSIGLATWHGHESVEDLFQCADLALLRAKRTGRNRVCEYRVGS